MLNTTLRIESSGSESYMRFAFVPRSSGRHVGAIGIADQTRNARAKDEQFASERVRLAQLTNKPLAQPLQIVFRRVRVEGLKLSRCKGARTTTSTSTSARTVGSKTETAVTCLWFFWRQAFFAGSACLVRQVCSLEPREWEQHNNLTPAWLELKGLWVLKPWSSVGTSSSRV